MGPIDTDALEYSGPDDFDPRLLAAREAFTGWDIYRLSWGWIVVPAGTVVYGAIDADGIVAKLRRASGTDTLGFPSAVLCEILAGRPLWWTIGHRPRSRPGRPGKRVWCAP
jgi:hypothetical protein